MGGLELADRLGPVKANIVPIAREVILAAAARGLPQFSVLYGYSASSVPEHSAGLAVDFMIYTPDNRGYNNNLGSFTADYLWDNRSRLGLRWEIFQQRVRSTSPGKPGTWQAMADRGSATQNHMDHVHAFFWEKAYQAPSGGTGSGANSGIPPILQNWDGSSYPGRAAFDLGSMHPAVTKLGQMLVAKGFGGAYKEGPGVPMGPADVENCAAFQRAQGWSGADADGYPGPETWSRLSGAGTPTQPVPAPPPAPASKEPPTQGYQGNVYLGKLRRGQQDSDSVKVFQRALRNYPDISTIPLNPSGVTGNYGSETEAMCRKVYETFNQWQPGAGWGDGDLGVPGQSLLAKLGCRIVG